MAKQHELQQRLLDDFCHAPGAQPGDKLPSLEQLCATYHASSPTLRRVLTGLAAKGWIETCWGKGSFIKRISPPANHRNGAEHLTIGFVVGNLRVPERPERTTGYSLTLELLEGLEASAHRLGAEVIVANSYGHTSKERDHVRRLQARGVAGVVVYPTIRSEEHDWLSEELREFPVVVADLYRPAMCRSHVIFDNVTAGREMTEHLLAQGRRRIAFHKFSPRHPVASVDERYHGYQLALRYAGLEPSLEFAPLEYPANIDEERHLRLEIDRLMALAAPPDAIIFPFDVPTGQGIAHLRKLGIAVPGTVLCAGFDNLQGERPGRWPTTQPDFRRLGERAAELLITSIQNRQAMPVEVLLPCPVRPASAGTVRSEGTRKEDNLSEQRLAVAS